VSSKRFSAAVAAFDRVHAQDPQTEAMDGTSVPRAQLFTKRLVDWVERVAPEADEALRLAAHCQHLGRWQRPRTDYEPGRIGYLRWRRDAAHFHAEQAAHILSDVGYDEAQIDAVRRIVLKRSLKTDRDAQAMEDALCLSFLEHEAEAFAAKHDDEKIIEILRRTWGKLSTRGRSLAQGLSLPKHLGDLLERALSAADSDATQ